MSVGKIIVENTQCDNCNEPILFTALDEVDVLNIGIMTLCGDCIDELAMCEDCSIRAKDSSDLTYVDNYDKYVCDDCLNTNYYRCDSCNEYNNNDCTRFINDDRICKSCFDDQVIECSWCNENIYETNGINFHGETICESCDDNYVIYCESCDDRIHTDDSYGNGYCENCWGENNEESGFTHYSKLLNYYKLHDEPSPRMYYGIELETGTLKFINFEEEVISKLSTKYFDRHEDSSIFDDGVKQSIEIVGHPMTYKWMKANPNIWNDVLKLRKKGLCSYKTNTCGIHIHLSKKAFDEHHLYKFMKMIYGFPSFTKLISQRSKNRLREWASIDGECAKNLKRKAKDKDSIRYTAVNLGGSYNTVEVRLFRGTLNEMTFWKNIEYIQALLEFTANAKVKELSIKNYLSYVCVKKHEFCNLYNWLKKKGKIKEVKENEEKTKV